MEIVLSIVSILAVIITPVASVMISQWLQKREAKRNDKMYIFQDTYDVENGMDI